MGQKTGETKKHIFRNLTIFMSSFTYITYLSNVVIYGLETEAFAARCRRSGFEC